MCIRDSYSADGWGEQMATTLELEGEQRDRVIAENFKSWLGRHSERKRNRLARAAAALVYETSLVRDIRSSRTLSDVELARIACPVLALYGEDSDAIGRGRHLAAVLPDCSLTVLPGCTHSVLWEQTAVVREQLAAFFAEGGG